MLLPVYRLGAHLAHRLPGVSGKLATALEGRRAAEARWLTWAQSARLTGPCVWIHASSVGEALTAAPVVARLRSAVGNLQVVHSYSSPSADGWPAPFEREYADYLPLDLAGPVTQVLNAVRPSLLVFARGDLWPELVTQAEAHGVPMAVIGAAVRPTSLRLRTPIRGLYREMVHRVSWIGAANPGDAKRWLTLGAPEERVTVSGDPRHDQVIERITNLTSLGSLPQWAARGPTLVAGSLEVSDEGVVFDAAQRVLSAHSTARCLVVPHSPVRSHLDRLAAHAAAADLAAESWTSGQREVPAARCVIVEASGVLADLYAIGSLAYVGGGFRSGTLHATIEPAAYGLPLLIGPRWQAFPDAEALTRNGGAVALPQRRAGGALAHQWLAWLDDDEARYGAGLAARRSLAQGAASLTAHRLLELFDADLGGGTSARR